MLLLYSILHSLSIYSMLILYYILHLILPLCLILHFTTPVYLLCLCIVPAYPPSTCSVCSLLPALLPLLLNPSNPNHLSPTGGLIGTGSMLLLYTLLDSL